MCGYMERFGEMAPALSPMRAVARTEPLRSPTSDAHNCPTACTQPAARHCAGRIAAALETGSAAGAESGPGLTGVAQIYAPRDIPRRQKFRYDELYRRRRGLALDLRLILLSFWITLRGSRESRGKKF